MRSNKNRQSLAEEMNILESDHAARFSLLKNSTDFDKDFVKVLNETRTKAMNLRTNHKDALSQQVTLRFIRLIDDQLTEHEKILAIKKAESEAAIKLQKQKEQKAKDRAKQKLKKTNKAEEEKAINPPAETLTAAVEQFKQEDDLVIHIPLVEVKLATAETQDKSFWKDIREGFVGGQGELFLQQLKDTGAYQTLFPSVNLANSEENEAWFKAYVQIIDLNVQENVTRFLGNPFRTNMQVVLVAKELDSSSSVEDIEKIHKLYQVSIPCDKTFQNHVQYIAGTKKAMLEHAKATCLNAADTSASSQPSNSF